MSERVQSVVKGLPLVEEDLTRIVEAAARGSDAAAEWLMTMYSTRKGLLCQAEETGSVHPHLLVAPSGVAGKITIRAAVYLAFSADATVYLASALAASDYGPFSSTAGADRYDLVYATLNRTVTVTGTRRQKTAGGLVDGTVDLATDPTVTIGVVPGVSHLDPLASLPADTSTAYCFGLAMVKLTDPYTSGAAITQGKIYQLWQGAAVNQHRLQSRRLGSGITGANKTSDYAKFSKARLDSGEIRIFAPIKYITNPTTGIVLDDGADWRRRVVRIMGMLPAADGGAYKVPSDVTIGGNASNFDSGLLYTGTNGAGATYNYSVTKSGATLDFRADATTGNMTVDISGAPNDGVNGDNWWIQIDGSPQMDGGAIPPY